MGASIKRPPILIKNIMPTITYLRTWCKTCSNFTLHTKPFNKIGKSGESIKWECKECKTELTDYTLAEISEEKIAEQRSRYNQSIEASPDKIIGRLLMGSNNSPFNEEWPKPEIIEDDAGQRIINQKLAEERYKKYLEQKRIREENERFKAKYSLLGRNDTCACGSGKKYKKCCLTKVESI